MTSVTETDPPDGIPLAKRNVAGHQHGINGMVKQADPLSLIRHHAPTIEHEDQTLALVDLKVLHGQLVSSRGRPPVDMSEIVIDRIISQSFKLVVLPYPACSFDTEETQAIGSSQHGIFPQLLHVWINIQCRFDGIVGIPMPQAKKTSKSDVHPIQWVLTPTTGDQLILERHTSLRLQSNIEPFGQCIKFLRHIVPQLKLQTPSPMVDDVQSNIVSFFQ